VTDNQENKENLGQEVDDLLDQGLDQKEIEKRGYSPSLIRQRIRKRHKEGKGAPAPSARKDSLALRKEKGSVLPEWLGRDVAQIFNGDIRDQRIFLAGISVPLIGMRITTELVKPLIDLLSVWQQGQAIAAREAQGSSLEVANAAGEAAAGGVAKYLMETKPWLSASPNPMQSMMADSMRPLLQQLIGQLMGGMMPPIQQPQAGIQTPQGLQPDQLAGTQQVSEEEIEEAFDD